MIEAAILVALTPLQTSIDTLTTRVESSQRRPGENFKVTTLKYEVADLSMDIDYLKSNDFTSLLEAACHLDPLETSDIPQATTEDVHRDNTVVDESDTDTDEEKIEIRVKSIYKDLPDLEETTVQSVIQTSLTEISMAAPSGAGPSEVTLGPDPQVQIDALGTDAQTDGVTE
ncbi:hypothetical protein H5410_040649 [Solanum commersonii]|uniref:Polyprotein protein n=1 Tax=Solanum commersonii TaxID=4109 RepID=A0A9J5XRI1_SOLCO|nr:hypothetical protein H5410_040649 [Solanum commersonii]